MLAKIENIFMIYKCNQSKLRPHQRGRCKLKQRQNVRPDPLAQRL